MHGRTESRKRTTRWYYEIVDAETLLPVQNWDDAEHVQGCITVYCGQRPVRLIDNVRYK